MGLFMACSLKLILYHKAQT